MLIIPEVKSRLFKYSLFFTLFVAAIDVLLRSSLNNKSKYKHKIQALINMYLKL